MSEIITEYRNENTKNIDLLSTIDIVRKINEEDQIVAKAVEDESDNIARAIDVIAKQFLVGGKLYYFGAGTSGRLGVLDASECPPTFGVRPDMERFLFLYILRRQSQALFLARRRFFQYYR